MALVGGKIQVRTTYHLRIELYNYVNLFNLFLIIGGKMIYFIIIVLIVLWVISIFFKAVRNVIEFILSVLGLSPKTVEFIISVIIIILFLKLIGCF